MGQLEDFIEEYNTLVVEDEKTSFYQLIHTGTDEVWHTFPSPADPTKVQAAISNMSLELPTGKHTVKVQAIAEGSKAIRGQVAQSLEGRSSAARTSMNDAISMAKATNMNVETASTQLANMSARLQAADERAREAEARAGEMIGEVYKMGDMVNKFVMERESAVLDREEREARMKSMMIIGQTMAPILGQAITIGSTFMELWITNKKEEMQANYEKQRQHRESQVAASPSSTNGASTASTEEKPN